MALATVAVDQADLSRNTLKLLLKTMPPATPWQLRTGGKISYREPVLRSLFWALREDVLSIPSPASWPLRTSLQQAFSVLG